MGLFDFLKKKKKTEEEEEIVVGSEELYEEPEEPDLIDRDCAILNNEEKEDTNEMEVIVETGTEKNIILEDEEPASIFSDVTIDKESAKDIDNSEIEKEIEKAKEVKKTKEAFGDIDKDVVDAIKSDLKDEVKEDIIEDISIKEPETMEMVDDIVDAAVDKIIEEIAVDEIDETLEVEITEKEIIKEFENEEIIEESEEVVSAEEMDIPLDLDEEDSEQEAEENIDDEAEEIEETEEELEEEKKVGFFGKMVQGLAKTRDNIMGNVENVLKAFTKIDEEFYEELEDALIGADIGAMTSAQIMDTVRDRVDSEKIKDTEEVRNVLIEEITKILEKDYEPLEIKSPTVILVIGVNGVGKTTTIGKLTAKYKKEGKSVLLAAGDTFRAAAIDQLQIWGDRNDVTVIKHQENSDPGAVVYDAAKSAKAKNIDVLICDTAGRLHNKKNLMEELKKIHRIINNEFETANVEVFLVLDGTTGQNALQQAKLFSEVADITGIVLTKLDGTAKGGVVIAINNEMNIPVRYVGFGEKADDLGEFNANDFAKALFSTEAE